MINEELARKIIRKLDRDINFNINIINSKGIIIASRDETREGSFHEVAFRMVEKGIDEEFVYPEDSPLIGTRPGVNLAISYNGDIIGVVGVTGPPEKVRELARALKTSIELMVELDELKVNEQHNQDKKKRFFDALLYDMPADLNKVEILSLQLGYRQKFSRIPILITINEPVKVRDVILSIKDTELLTDQDFIIPTKEGDLLLYRVQRVPDSEIILKIKDETRRLLDAFERSIRENIRYCLPAFYIGAVQNHYGSYRDAFNQVKWLSSNHRDSTENCVFLMDHVLPYFLSQIPRIEYFASFKSINDTLSVSQKVQVFETVQALIRANLSIKTAAMELGVHRNTITARIEKIREIFGVDILNDSSGRDFLQLLVSFEKFPG